MCVIVCVCVCVCVCLFVCKAALCRRKTCADNHTHMRAPPKHTHTTHTHTHTHTHTPRSRTRPVSPGLRCGRRPHRRAARARACAARCHTPVCMCVCCVLCVHSHKPNNGQTIRNPVRYQRRRHVPPHPHLLRPHVALARPGAHQLVIARVELLGVLVVTLLKGFLFWKGCACLRTCTIARPADLNAICLSYTHRNTHC